MYSITTAVEKLKELQSTSLDSQLRITLVQNYIEPRLLEWVHCACSEIDKFIYPRSGYYFPTDSSIGEQPLTYLADSNKEVARLMRMHNRMRHVERYLLMEGITM